MFTYNNNIIDKMGKRHNRHANRLMNSFSNLASFSDTASTISNSNALSASNISIVRQPTIVSIDTNQAASMDFDDPVCLIAEAGSMQDVATSVNSNDNLVEGSQQQVIPDGSATALTPRTDTLNVFNSYPAFVINDKSKHQIFIPNQGDTTIYSSDEDDWFNSLLFDLEVDQAIAECEAYPNEEEIDLDNCYDITAIRDNYDDIEVLLDYTTEAGRLAKSSHLSAADSEQQMPADIRHRMQTIFDESQSYMDSPWPEDLHKKFAILGETSDVCKIVTIQHKKAIVQAQQEHNSRLKDDTDTTNGDHNLTNVFIQAVDYPNDLGLHRYSGVYYTAYLQIQTHYGAPRRSTIDNKLTYYVSYHALSELKKTIPILQSQIEVVIPILFNLDMHFENIITDLSQIAGHNALSQTHVFPDIVKALGYTLHQFLNDPFVFAHAEAHFPTVKSFEFFTNNLQNVNVPFSAFFLMLLRIYHFSQVYTDFVEMSKRFYYMSAQSRIRDSHTDNPSLLEVSRDMYSRKICEILKGFDDAVSLVWIYP